MDLSKKPGKRKEVKRWTDFASTRRLRRAIVKCTEQEGASGRKRGTRNWGCSARKFLHRIEARN